MGSEAVSATVDRLALELVHRCARMVTAESCTGGGVAVALTDRVGSSAWFECGYVTYSNAAKQRDLGVPEALIREHGAVSVEVAGAMAEGAARRAGCAYAVAISGIAGPGGATPGKPVGTVCFGFYLEGRLIGERHHFDGDRDAVRSAAVRHTLDRLLELIESAGASSDSSSR